MAVSEALMEHFRTVERKVLSLQKLQDVIQDTLEETTNELGLLRAHLAGNQDLPLKPADSAKAEVLASDVCGRCGHFASAHGYHNRDVFKMGPCREVNCKCSGFIPADSATPAAPGQVRRCRICHLAERINPEFGRPAAWPAADLCPRCGSPADSATP